MIFFLPHLAEKPFRLFRRMNPPPNSSSVKVIPVEKKEDWIFDAWALKKILWQDDEKTFLLI
jgi:hypothetical protein